MLASEAGWQYMSMNQPRILVALELLSYREAVAEVIGVLLPDTTVMLSEPGDVERSVALSPPTMVICSRVVPAVEKGVPFWVEMYREHGSSSTIKTPGYRREVPGLELSDLADVLQLVKTFVDDSAKTVPQ